MGFRRVSNPGTADSQTVIANSTRSLLEALNFPGQIRPSGDDVVAVNFNRAIESETQGLLSTNVVESLTRGAAHNAPVTERRVEGLQKPALSATESENLDVRIRADIPTADLVDNGGFKVGSKLLIKVVASPSNTKAPDKAAPNLTFDNFSLQGIAEADGERYQIHETFGEEVVYLFGRRPRVWTMQGIVLNGRRAPAQGEGPETAAQTAAREAKDMDFANMLIRNWNEYYRGTKAVEARARAYISYEDSVIEATLVELTVVRNAQIPSAANATMTFIVHERAFIGEKFSNGVDVQQLAQLQATIDANGNIADTVPASDIIPRRPTLDEIVRRENEAEAKAAASTAALMLSEEEVDNLRQQLIEIEADLENEENLRADIRSDLSDAAPDQESFLFREFAASEKRTEKLRGRAQSAEARLGLAGEEVATGQATQRAANAERDALAATRAANYAGQAL